jgi:hypothetical protein
MLVVVFREDPYPLLYSREGGAGLHRILTGYEISSPTGVLLV